MGLCMTPRNMLDQWYGDDTVDSWVGISKFSLRISQVINQENDKSGLEGILL